MNEIFTAKGKGSPEKHSYNNHKGPAFHLLVLTTSKHHSNRTVTLVTLFKPLVQTYNLENINLQMWE